MSSSPGGSDLALELDHLGREVLLALLRVERLLELRDLLGELGHRGLPPRSKAFASTGGAAQPAVSERRLLPRPPRTPPPGHLLDISTIAQ